MLNPGFRDMLAGFNGAAVEYMVVGGHAVAHHGYPRATGDMDIPFVGVHHLLMNKRATGRPQDLTDVARLEAALRKA